MVRIIFLSLLLVPAYVQAQNNTNDTFSATWFNAGTGVSTSGVSFIGGISHQIDASLLSVRGTASNILFGDEFWDIGMLYGRTTDSRKFHQSISIGLGIVGGIRREGGLFSLEPIETEKIPLTPNIPIELKMYWRPFRYFGLGTYFFANLNTEHSNIGGALSIKIGKMW